jgi:competence protein ComEC
MTRACLTLLAGVYALQLSSFERNSDRIELIFLIFLLALLVGRTSDFIWFLLGLALFGLAANGIMTSRLPPEYAGDSIVAAVRIADFPVPDESSVSFLVEPLYDLRLPPHVRLSWFEPPVQLRLGDIWQLELRLRRPRGSSNPGVFDYEAWLFRESIGATGYVVGGHRNHLKRSGDLGVIDRLRQRFVDRVSVQSPESAGVLAAISVGARHLITTEQWDRYARTGTSHLMAISGLHVGLAAGVGYVLASVISGLLIRGGSHHSRATVFALLVAVSYALFSGLAIPARRASLMIAFVALAVLRRRQVQPLNVLVLACIAVTITSPVATMAPGFTLSFAAVLVLIWLAQRLTSSPDRKLVARSVFAVRQLSVVQGFLLLGLLPLTVLIFDRIAFVAPVVNLVSVPVFSLVTVPFTLAGLLLDGRFQVIGDAMLRVAALSHGYIEKMIAVAAEIPGAGHTLSAVTGFAWALLFLPLMWVVLPPGWPGRRLALIGVIALVLHQPPRPAYGCVAVELLDIGQGLAVVLQTEAHTVVFDTGPAFRVGGSAADTVILPYLASKGIDHVDKLIVSHADLDHSGGVEALVAGISVAELLVGESLVGHEQVQAFCNAGEQWNYDGIGFSLIYPPKGAPRDGNDASCVLQVEAGDYQVLVTGDIERSAEKQLVSNDVLSRVNAVVVPHHGSRTSSTAPFVRALAPDLALVSAGFDNRWGFPKEDVVARWTGVGARVLETSTSGAIGIRLCVQSGIEEVIQNRHEHRRIWND